MVSSLAGMVVAVVSAVFGICAHGMAAGTGIALPTPGQTLFLLAASAGIGAATAAVARKRSPVATSAAGLLVGQGVVHMALVSGHDHGAGGHSPAGHAGHMVDPAAVRAALDGATTAAAAHGAHADALLTPGMLGAHVAAIGATLAVVAVLGVTLAWIAARVVPLLAAAHLVVVDEPTTRGRTVAPDQRYLLSGGPTRAPPVSV